MLLQKLGLFPQC